MKYLSFLLFCLITTTLLSQEQFTVNEGKMFFEEKKHTYLDFTIKDNQGGYVLIRPDYSSTIGGFKPKGFFIEHYDKNLNMLKLSKYGDKKTKILYAFILENKLHIIEGKTNLARLRNRTVKLIAKTAELDNFSFTENEFFSFNLNEKYGEILDFFDRDREDLENNFVKFIVSENKKIIGLNFSIKAKESEYHNTFLFDNKFNQIHHNEIALKTKDKSFAYDNMSINEQDQSVYLVGRYYPNLGFKKSKGQELNFEVYKLNNSNKKSLNLKIGGGYVGSLYPKLIGDKIYLITCYQNMEQKFQRGLAFFEVDHENFEVSNKFLIPVKQGLLNDNLPGKGLFNGMFSNSFNNKYLFNFRLKNLYKTEENDFLLVAEEYYRYQQSNGQNSVPMDYHGGILTLRFTDEGKVKACTLIDKNQFDAPQSSNYNSVLNIYNDSKIHYLFNYKKKKEGKKGDKVKFKSSGKRKLNLVLITVDSQGNVIENNIKPYKDGANSFMVRSGYHDKELKELLLFGNNPKEKKKQLMKLSFD
ncbi:hypothetical protein [Aquimarina sp. MMG016]|uniref:hypothetical protein n=1 Tax=Aquimarina sp. MMG016 TaxID=2822690 RepID=UPI001B39F5CA|nr:hypothetical protein [Aquimarina sp. MMG016]MBQ4822074.1 hypothetical protein [Aquimarina sp. MMG016]